MMKFKSESDGTDMFVPPSAAGKGVKKNMNELWWYKLVLF